MLHIATSQFLSLMRAVLMKSVKKTTLPPAYTAHILPKLGEGAFKITLLSGLPEMQVLGDIHEYLVAVALFVKSRGINFAEFPNTAKTL